MYTCNTPRGINIIIAGSRHFSTKLFPHLEEQIMLAIEDIRTGPLRLNGGQDDNWVNYIISGGARGADRMGEMYAHKHGKDLRIIKPNWHPNGIYNPSAGYDRNEVMAEDAHALIAIWDGESNGTKHMIDTMYNQYKPVVVINVKEQTRKFVPRKTR